MSFYHDQCRPGKRHEFDYYSGYCVRGCGVRDDGRVTSRSGDILNTGPDYTQAELDKFRERLERKAG